MNFRLAGARLLCLSPHPDDIELGLGATLHKYRGQVNARILVFSDRHESRGEQRNLENQVEAAALLGVAADSVRFVDQIGHGFARLRPRFMASEENRDIIRRIVERVTKDFQPDIIFVPSVHETHQDHVAVGEEVVRIVRGAASILGYEVPKHNRHFQPNTFVRASDADIEAKIAAVQRYTEFTTRYYFEPEGIRALARMRALQAGHSGLVEAFELYRLSVS